MNKNLRLILVGIALCVGYILLRSFFTHKAVATYRIGILQTASHPALDTVRDAFTQTITRQLGTDVEIVVKNGQGVITTIHSLAKQLQADKTFDMFVALATPAAQALATVEKNRPVIVAAVTDPVALGLMRPEGNICGVSDMIDIPGQIDMIEQLFSSAHTIGLLYTAGEANATLIAKKMEQELRARGKNVLEFTLSGEADITGQVGVAARKVDVIVAPTDNTVALAISLIARILAKYKKPLVVSDVMLLSYGAFAARGVDYRACGQKAGEIASALKGGKKPSEIPLEYASSTNILVNKTVMDALGITLSPELAERVELVVSNKDRPCAAPSSGV